MSLVPLPPLHKEGVHESNRSNLHQSEGGGGGEGSASWWQNPAAETGLSPQCSSLQVPKQHNAFARAIVFGVLGTVHESFQLDEIRWKLFES